MIKGGLGGSLTQSGLSFEKRVDLRVLFNKLEGYSLQGNNLLFQNKVVGKMYKKHEVYSELLPSLNIIWSNKISKKLLPDESILILSNNTLYIIEIKFQEVAGSVDEKLQTCDFKKKQYQKLFLHSNIKIEYVYVLNDWFKKEEYKDVLNYISSVGCHYFFENLPLKFLNLPTN